MKVRGSSGKMITILGVNSTIAGLKKKKEGVDFGLRTAMQKVALFEEANVKKSIAGHSAEPKSVDTGRFANSVTGRYSKNAAKISSSVPYSTYLEFGTSKIGARHHFKNTLARDKQEIETFLKRDIKIGLL